MKKLLLFFFVVSFHISLAIYLDHRNPVYFMERMELNIAMKGTKIDLFKLIHQQKSNLFTKKEIDFFFQKYKDLKKSKDFFNFFLNHITEKQKEVIYPILFKMFYIYNIKNTIDIGSGTDSVFYSAYKKLEKCLRVELKKISKKKYNYQELNRIYKKYRDRIIKEMDKLLPGIFQILLID